MKKNQYQISLKGRKTFALAISLAILGVFWGLGLSSFAYADENAQSQTTVSSSSAATQPPPTPAPAPASSSSTQPAPTISSSTSTSSSAATTSGSTNPSPTSTAASTTPAASQPAPTVSVTTTTSKTSSTTPSAAPVSQTTNSAATTSLAVNPTPAPSSNSSADTSNTPAPNTSSNSVNVLTNAVLSFLHDSISSAASDVVENSKDLISKVSDINGSNAAGISSLPSPASDEMNASSTPPLKFTASSTPATISSIDTSLTALANHHAVSSKIQKAIQANPLQSTIVPQEADTNYFAGLGAQEAYTPSEVYSFKGLAPETTDGFVGAATLFALVGGGLMMQYSRSRKYTQTSTLINEIA